ncbi:MAG TPA: PKD domain-containing protein, partial [Conexibacter sp.]|nr:PKD domain-containing protein [Conexibacter sp.]
MAGALPLFATAAAPAADPSTDLVSVSSTGAKGNSDSYQPDISADGRWVAFSSFANNLVPGGSGRESIYLRDRLRGETRLVSAGAGGAPPNGASSRASISDDGRFVAFYSAATNLTESPGGYQAYVYDRDQGTVRRVSTNVAPTTYYRHVNDADVSGDGRWVAFHAANNDISRTDVFLYDVAGGAVRRLGEPSPGVQASSSVTSPSVSGDGRFVAYSSAAAGLVPGDLNSRGDVIVENIATGAKERVSLTSTDGESNGDSSSGVLDHDGCVVAFVSSATNLVAGASGAGSKAFVRDRCAGDTEAVSVSNAGEVGTVSGGPSISGDGCTVAFATRGVLVPAPGNLATAVRDRCRGLTSRADVSTAGEPSNGAAAPNSVSLGGVHGRYVAFMSTGGNLAGIDGDGVFDIFVRDRANNIAPTASLQLSQDGSSVTVDACGSRDPDGYQLSGAVSFGDGSPDAGGLAATHRYARGGSYTVALTVTDADGATARAFQTVTVPDPPAGGGGGDGGGGGGGPMPPGGGPGAPGSGPGGGSGARPPALRLTGA